MKYFLIGASRGFGYSVYQALQKRGEAVQVCSRKNPNQIPLHFSFDASKEEDFSKMCESLSKADPEVLIYFPGGGPWGLFSEKSYKDHEWAFRVTFLTASRLLHWVLAEKRGDKMPRMKQVCFIGSAIAESQIDPRAASYCAAKHALKGLVTTVQNELKEDLLLDLRLFSPPYIDTELLPVNAAPRKNKAHLADPHQLAEYFLKWLESKNDILTHLEVKYGNGEFYV
jgi:short-subunit dehydrogenase